MILIIIINLKIHCINAGLVYRLGFVFTRSRFHAIGASILFSFFFLNYDPGLWPLGGFPYVMTTFLVLLSFLSFVKYRQTGVRHVSLELWPTFSCGWYSIELARHRAGS